MDTSESHKRAQELTFDLLQKFADEDLIVSASFYAALTIMMHASFDIAPSKSALIGMVSLSMAEAFEKMEKD